MKFALTNWFFSEATKLRNAKYVDPIAYASAQSSKAHLECDMLCGILYELPFGIQNDDMVDFFP